jgi:hypothetical protein
LIPIKIFQKCEIDETLPKLIKGKALTQKRKGRNKKERTKRQHPSLQKHKLRLKKRAT